ncbi:MAG: ATP-binding protein [Spirochaetia bacterium]|jgi:PAS domain S-box-containing protein
MNAARPWHRLKLSGKMILFFIVLVLSQSFVTLTILTTIISRTNLDALKAQMSDSIRGVEGYLQETLNDLQVKGDLIAGQQKTIDYTHFGLKNLLVHELVLFKESLGIESLTVFIDAAIPFASTSELTAGDAAFQEQLGASFQGRRKLFIAPAEGSPVLFVLSPIKRTDRIIGALSLSLRLDRRFVTRIERIINAPVVLRFDGEFIHDGTLPEKKLDEAIAAFSRSSASDQGAVRAGQFIVSALDLTRVGLSGGTIFCLMGTAVSARQINRYNLISLCATLLILGAALVSGIAFYQRTVLHRLQRILQGITHISQGDFTPPFQLPWQDELGQLARAFDDMCRNLLVRDRELSQLSRYNTLVLDSVRSGIISVSLSGEITAFNSAAARILLSGVKSPLGMPLDDTLVPPGLLQIFRESLREDVYPAGREIALPGRDGLSILAVSSSPLLSSDGSRIGIIVIFEDITREKSLEEKLALSTKLAALGEMAAGVAHQVRNPLVVMKVSSEMLRDNFTVNENAQKYGKLTRLIVDEIDALNLVVSNFLDFARPRKVTRAPCDVRAAVEFALQSLPVERFPGVTVRTVIPEAVRSFAMDKNLVTQALSNLVLNALQASRPGGAVEVRCSTEDGSLRIEVQDWGEGMNEETMRCVFDPFFTTRDSGMGLGLSIVHRIIENHGGTIDVRSCPGSGSTFSVVLQGE